MPYRRSGRYYGRRSNSRKKMWVRSAYTLGTQTQDACFDIIKDPGINLSGNTAMSTVVPPLCTVLRIRGTLAFEFGGLGISNEVTAGLLVTHTEQDILNPEKSAWEDSNSEDWLWHSRLPQIVGGTEVVATTGTYLTVWPIDTRSKRKMNDPSDTVMFYWRASEPISQVHANFSTLLLLP